MTKTKEQIEFEERRKEFKQVVKENNKIRDNIEAIMDDFNMEESRKDLWFEINALIENEIEQEDFCE